MAQFFGGHCDNSLRIALWLLFMDMFHAKPRYVSNLWSRNCLITYINLYNICCKPIDTRLHPYGRLLYLFHLHVRNVPFSVQSKSEWILPSVSILEIWSKLINSPSIHMLFIQALSLGSFQVSCTLPSLDMKTISTGNDPSWLQLRFVSKKREKKNAGFQWENYDLTWSNWDSQVLRYPVWQTNEVPRLPMRFPTCLRAAAVFFSRLFQDSSANDSTLVTPIAPFLKDIMYYDSFWEKTWVNL